MSDKQIPLKTVIDYWKFKKRMRWLGYVLAVAGIWIVWYETSFWVVVGIFLMLMANNIDREYRD